MKAIALAAIIALIVFFAGRSLKGTKYEQTWDD